MECGVIDGAENDLTVTIKYERKSGAAACRLTAEALRRKLRIIYACLLEKNDSLLYDYKGKL